MKFLDLPQVTAFNSFLESLSTPDGLRLHVRLEPYTCKAAGRDKKTLRMIESRYGSSSDISACSEAENEGEPLESKARTSHLESLNAAGLSLKAFYYLVSTMNIMFPDYDFSEAPPEVFSRPSSLHQLITHINTSIFNTGLDRNTTAFSDFCRQLWDCIDSAMGGLDQCDIYTFKPEGLDVMDDPFRERGTIWSTNAFFLNKRLKRVLVLNVRAVNDTISQSSIVDELRSSTSTPVSV